MIKLTKNNPPKVLVDNAAAWTATLLQKIGNGIDPTPAEKARYRHRDVKSALEVETAGKCAYCESKLKHIHHGDVEHIFPKSLDPSKQFEWDNLTLACEICNQNKSNRDPKLENIIDPYIKDPKDHLLFVGAMAFSRGTPEGVSSISLLDLNRAALVEMRNETVNKIMGVIEILHRRDIPVATKKIILEDLEKNEAGEKSQYSAVVKSVVAQMKPHLPPEIVAPPA